MPRDRIQPLNAVTHWLSLSIWIAIGLFVFVIAAFRMQSGFAVDRAFPVPIYMVMGVPVPHGAYVQAAQTLQHANPKDGEAMIAAAEAATRAGALPLQVIPRARLGLQKSPASARGWTLLAEEYLAERRGPEATRALSTALLLSPFDYWIAGRRAHVAAALLDDLDHDTRASADRQAELLWETPGLRDEIPGLLRAPGGRRLMAEALATDSQSVRALNRWLAGERRRQQGIAP